MRELESTEFKQFILLSHIENGGVEILTQVYVMPKPAFFLLCQCQSKFVKETAHHIGKDTVEMASALTKDLRIIFPVYRQAPIHFICWLIFHS